MVRGQANGTVCDTGRQLLWTDAQGAADALQQRLERLLDGSKEASKQRADLTEVRNGAVFHMAGKEVWL